MVFICSLSLIQGDISAFKQLLKVIDIDCPDGMGRTALIYAILGNQVSRVLYMKTRISILLIYIYVCHIYIIKFIPAHIDLLWVF